MNDGAAASEPLRQPGAQSAEKPESNQASQLDNSAGPEQQDEQDEQRSALATVSVGHARAA